MASGRPSNGDAVIGGRQEERLHDVGIRLARIEGKIESLATKTDIATTETLIANAKYSLTIAWIGIGVAVLLGLIGVGATVVKLFVG